MSKRTRAKGEAPADTMVAPKDEVHKQVNTLAKPVGKPDEDGAIFEKKRLNLSIFSKSKISKTKRISLALPRKTLTVLRRSTLHSVLAVMELKAVETAQTSKPYRSPTNLREWKLKFGTSIR